MQLIIVGLLAVGALVSVLGLVAGSRTRSSNSEASARPTQAPLIPIATLVARVLEQKTPPSLFLTATSGTRARPTLNPAYFVRNADQAIRVAAIRLNGHEGGMSYARVDRVEYVETTAGQAFALLSPPVAANLAAYKLQPDAPVWAFVAHGAFRTAAYSDRLNPTPGAKRADLPLMWAVVIKDAYRWDLGDPTSRDVDLATLGTPIEIPLADWDKLDGSLETPPTPAPTGGCCTLALDLDPATPGIQASLATKDAQDVSIDIVLGDNVGNVSAFDVKLIYDDTKLTSLGNGKGGLDGNPDFNDIALGSGWDCSLSGSPSADTDPETGEGHGVALLSCFATGAGAPVTSPTTIATLHLHAAAAVSTGITLSDVHLSHDDGTEIGSCNPVLQVELTCTAATLTAG